MTEQDLYLFNEGRNYRAYEKMGSHLTSVGETQGTSFSVWAPNAREVTVIGSFNGWDHRSHPLHPCGSSGIWEGFIPGVTKGSVYKFHIVSNRHGHVVDKADPFGLLHEKPPRTASVVWDLEYQWTDQDWMKSRRRQKFPAGADFHLRGPSRFMDAGSEKNIIARSPIAR